MAAAVAIASGFTSRVAAAQARVSERATTRGDDDDELTIVNLDPASAARGGARLFHFEFGLRGGIALGVTGLDPGPAAGVEIGMRRSFAAVDGFIHLRAEYESHTMRGEGDLPCDANPPSMQCLGADIAHYRYALVEYELHGVLALGFRLRALHPRWSPYASFHLGYVHQRVESTVFALTNVEHRQNIAFGGTIGVQYQVGVFAPFLELIVRYAPTGALQTGVSQLSLIQLAAGVRFAI